MKVGIIYGAFNFSELESDSILKSAKDYCEYLICAIETNPILSPPAESVVFRYQKLKKKLSIDEIVPYQNEDDLLDILTAFKIDIVLLHGSLKGSFIGKKYCTEKNIKICNLVKS